MTRRPLFSILLLCLPLLAASACAADDEACGGDSCERAEPNQAGQSDPADVPLPCRQACEALTGACGDDEPGDTTAERAVAACIGWCDAGGLSADEATCLAEAGCTSSLGCLAD